MQCKDLMALIQSKDFEIIKAEREKELYRIIAMYKKGLVTETEAKDDFMCAVLFGDRNGREITQLRKALGLSKLSYEDSIQFVADYRHWTNNEEINGGWFDNLCFNWNSMDMVSSDDGAEFRLSGLEVLQLVDAILIPICAYEPIPPEIPEPVMDSIHVYANKSIYGIPFNCVDDGGLLSDSNPVGKSFDLTRNDGVKMHIMITEFRPEGTPYKHRNFVFSETSDHYLGIGTIDDYYFKNTIPPRENLSFELSKANTINYIVVTAFHEGEGATYSIDFPRWKEYLDYCRERKTTLDQEINQLSQQMILSADL